MIGADEILQILPHRFPFLLVDRVLEIDTEAISIVAQKNVSHNEPFFTGHFPGRPIMPGVLIIEAMAQAALLCIFGGKIVDSRSDFLFVGIEKAKFRRAVLPGDQLRIEMKTLRRRNTFWKIEGTALVDGEVAAEAVITAIVTPPSKES
ncbi:MAG: 3-hydroxyacyl-ACP dehydratase FabZ [bacterium]